MIAHLELSITQHPVWWNLDDITDLELLATVYGKVVEFENSFFLRSTGAGTTTLVGGSTGGGEGDTPTADAGGNVTKVVGTEVQSSLEP